MSTYTPKKPRPFCKPPARQTYVFLGPPSDTDNIPRATAVFEKTGEYLLEKFRGKSFCLITSLETLPITAMQAVRAKLGLEQGIIRLESLNKGGNADAKFAAALREITDAKVEAEVVIVMAQSGVCVPNKLPLSVAVKLSRQDIVPQHKNRFGKNTMPVLPGNAFVVQITKGTSLMHYIHGKNPRQ